MIRLWNHLAQLSGFDGMYIIGTIGNFFYDDEETKDIISTPEIDSVFHFMPMIYNCKFFKHLSEYPMNRIAEIPKKVQYLGHYTGFDNRVRRNEGATVFHVSVETFENGLRKAFYGHFDELFDYNTINFQFVTAWNEWNEQAILEPNDVDGFGYLKAIKKHVFGLQPYKTHTSSSAPKRKLFW